MNLQPKTSELSLSCHENSSIKWIAEKIAPFPKTVYLESAGQVRGIILDFHSLIEAHSFYASPFPIGSLLRNAAAAYLLSMRKGKRKHAQKLSLDGSPWLELRNTAGKIIALVHDRAFASTPARLAA
jgi:hypothetical protein